MDQPGANFRGRHYRLVHGVFLKPNGLGVELAGQHRV